MKILLDGGIADPIPLKKSEEDGNPYNILILTRGKEYEKKQSRISWLAKRIYREYPALVEKLNNRHSTYNDTLLHIQEQEDKGNVFVFRPSLNLKVSSIERNSSKLSQLYELGYNDAKSQYRELMLWIERCKANNSQSDMITSM
jgi:predicted patatin/cPLA2 family phospholipase